VNATAEIARTTRDVPAYSGISHGDILAIVQSAGWGFFDQEEIKVFTVS
jgi:hypothetical protein